MNRLGRSERSLSGVGNKVSNVKNDDRSEPSDADQPTKIKPRAISVRTPENGRGKGTVFKEPQTFKERQSAKLKELSDALIAAGFLSLDEQATALGLSRSTTWTILKAKHKNYGLSGSLINRILKRPGLDRRIRAKIVEYVQEKASGCYGHNKIQLRRFKERLSLRATITNVYQATLSELTPRTKRVDGPKKSHWPTLPEA